MLIQNRTHLESEWIAVVVEERAFQGSGRSGLRARDPSRNKWLEAESSEYGVVGGWGQSRRSRKRSVTSIH
ncbi:hypothetical protein Acr_00g0104100 [Actinidia rufa]|uniref:Uncharacterized protein n=1 Tax=Actinidia rufa TaxID=165716 RepID=A0A7J0E0V3_9ERIC|nr:hypothetical protein Acr_00g0104100 [Actinidia rufa]